MLLKSLSLNLFVGPGTQAVLGCVFCGDHRGNNDHGRVWCSAALLHATSATTVSSQANTRATSLALFAAIMKASIKCSAIVADDFCEQVITVKPEDIAVFHRDLITRVIHQIHGEVTTNRLCHRVGDM